jgi:hypothetical protein
MTSTRPPDKPSAGAELDDRPPVLGSWRNIYGAVLGSLVVVVLVFWLITKAYA